MSNDEAACTWLYVLVPSHIANDISAVADATGLSQNDLVSRFLSRQLDFVIAEESVELNAVGYWEKDGGAVLHA